MANRGDKTNGALGFYPGGKELQTGTGGIVPGQGKGDKVAAKYEPGEAVVSNAMLDAAPGLREYLQSLREKVLAGEGLTPEQANALATQGGELRAARGYLEDDPASRFSQTPAQVIDNNNRTASGFNAERAQTLQRIDAPGRVAGSTFVPAPDPRVMTQGPAGVTAPGQPYAAPSTALQMVPERPMAAVNAGRSFTPPSNLVPDPNTIYQGANTAAPANLAATPKVGTGLALTQDAGRSVKGMAAPANQSFANGPISPEAASYQAARAAPAPATTPAPAATSWKATAGNVAKNLGIGALGFGAARVMDGMDNNAPESAPDTRANVNAIPTGGNAPAPAAQPATGWWDTDTGRNVSNTLNAVTPMLGPLSSGFRAGSIASRAANTGAAVVGGMAAGANPPNPAQTAADAQANPAPAPAVAPVAPAAGINPASAPKAGEPANPNAISNNITREGNSYSGSNISDGFTINGQPPRNGGAISTQNQAAAQALSDRYQAEAVRGFTPGAQAGPELTAAQRSGNFTPAGGDTGGFGLLDRSKREKWNAEVTLSSITANKAQKQVAAAEIANINARDAQAASEAGNMTRFGMQDATARRGQDATFSASQASNALARQRLGLEGQELGLKQTAAGFQNRSAKRIEDLQAAYEAAPAEGKAAIAEQLRVLTGKDKPAQWKALALQGATDAMGNKTEGVLAAVNEQTGEVKRLDGQSAAKSTTQYKVGQVHQDANGNRATWDGKNWTPVK